MIKVRAHHGMCLFFFIGKGHRPEICGDCGWNELCILK